MRLTVEVELDGAAFERTWEPEGETVDSAAVVDLVRRKLTQTALEVLVSEASFHGTSVLPLLDPNGQRCGKMLVSKY